jgi:hypothetical protein
MWNLGRRPLSTHTRSSQLDFVMVQTGNISIRFVC